MHSACMDLMADWAIGHSSFILNIEESHKFCDARSVGCKLILETKINILMAEGNWVKPGTEPWPPPGEQYPGSSGGGMEAERMGEIWVIWGPDQGD